MIFTVNLLLNVQVKEFMKSVDIWRRYGEEYDRPNSFLLFWNWKSTVAVTSLTTGWLWKKHSIEYLKHWVDIVGRVESNCSEFLHSYFLSAMQTRKNSDDTGLYPARVCLLANTIW